MTDADANGLLAGISERLIKVLPPAFIVLTLLNVFFLAAMMWVITHNADQRNAMLSKIVDSCLTKQSQ